MNSDIAKQEEEQIVKEMGAVIDRVFKERANEIREEIRLLAERADLFAWANYEGSKELRADLARQICALSCELKDLGG